MRLLILKSKRSSQYSGYVQQLLIRILTEKNDFINTPFDIASSTPKDENKIFSRTLINSGIFGFFKSLRVRLFIKKQNITWLVLLSYNKFFSPKLPQILIPSTLEKLSLREPLPGSAKIIVGSLTQKNKLISLYPFAETHVHVVPFSAAQSFQPVSWSEQQLLKLELTQGREFFLLNLADASEERFINLLKAFTTFKKWQNSNMKLVINFVAYPARLSELKEILSTYRFRGDVVLPNDGIAGKEYIILLSSAYAFLHFPSAEDDVIPLLQAMQCEAPCIAFKTAVIEEYTNHSALLIELSNHEQLSEKMILLYKDENLRNKLIEMGKQQAMAYTQAKAIEALTYALPANLH